MPFLQNIICVKQEDKNGKNASKYGQSHCFLALLPEAPSYAGPLLMAPIIGGAIISITIIHHMQCHCRWHHCRQRQATPLSGAQCHQWGPNRGLQGGRGARIRESGHRFGDSKDGGWGSVSCSCGQQSSTAVSWWFRTVWQWCVSLCVRD